VFGEMTNEKLMDIKDVTAAEFLILGLLSIGTLVLGVVPQLAFDLTHQSTADILGMIGQETAP
jgi:NADH-quinone oxidoreductase subunit M